MIGVQYLKFRFWCHIYNLFFAKLVAN